MNLTIERGPALSALSRVVGVVERRHTIPILANVALSATGGRLSMRATDLEMEAIETVDANIGDAGEITIPADKLHDIVRSADPGAQIKVFNEDTDPRLKVRSGRSNFSLPAMSAQDFPRFSAEGLGPEFAIPAKTLADMISRVSWAVKKMQGSLVPLCHVFLGTRDGELHAVGCSDSGIALRREPTPEGAEMHCILPAKLVGQAIKWLADADGDVFVSSSENLIRLRHEAGQLTSKLFDWPAGYVDYLRVLLESHELTARTDQDAMKAALRRALIMQDQKSHAVRLTFAGGALTVQARNDQAGEGADEIPADYDGPDVTFLLSAAALDNALSALKGDVLEFGFAPKPIDRNVPSIQVIVRAPSDASFVVNLAQPRA